jgi:hypothetical protein
MQRRGPWVLLAKGRDDDAYDEVKSEALRILGYVLQQPTQLPGQAPTLPELTASHQQDLYLVLRLACGVAVLDNGRFVLMRPDRTPSAWCRSVKPRRLGLRQTLSDNNARRNCEPIQNV